MSTLFGLKRSDLNEDLLKELDTAVHQARIGLADAAVSVNVEQLGRHVDNIAELEGVRDVVWRTLKWLEHPEATPEKVAFRLLDHVAQGADDRWSGRGNDLKRTNFDAVRDTTQRVVSVLLRGTDFE